MIVKFGRWSYSAEAAMRIAHRLRGVTFDVPPELARVLIGEGLLEAASGPVRILPVPPPPTRLRCEADDAPAPTMAPTVVALDASRVRTRRVRSPHEQIADVIGEIPDEIEEVSP